MSNESDAIEPYAPNGPHASRRFIRHLTKVRQLLDDAARSQPKALPGDVLFQSGARTPMFMLQALGRVYEHLALDDALFARIRQESKIVEDALGMMDFWQSVTRKCQEWSLPAGTARLAHERYLESAGRTWAWVESQDWLPCRYHPGAELLPDRFVRKLRKINWHSPKRESKLLNRWLHDDLHHIQQAIGQLDLNEIEAGLHKARREVRWISIYFTAVEGAFVVNRMTKAPEHWDRYRTKDIVENPYNRLPTPEPDDVPISVPAPLLYALSYFIDRMGVIKDRAQWTETAEKLIELSGEKLDKPLSAMMGDNYLEAGEATRQGRELFDQVFVKDRLLLRLADSLGT